MPRAQKREDQPWLRYLVLPLLLILFGLLVSTLVFPKPAIAPSEETDVPKPSPTPTPTPTIFCGGIAGIECPSGYECQLEGRYPDAGGKCITKKYICPKTAWVNCVSGPDVGNRPQCDPDFLKWAKENCPSFKGTAY